MQKHGEREGFRIFVIEYIDMKPLYTELELKDATSRQKMPCECLHCGITFFKPKNEILDCLSRGLNKNGQVRRTNKFCSETCSNRHKNTIKPFSCNQCHKTIFRNASTHRQSKSGNAFCSCSCAAKWNNAHKTHGTRVSKLEIWLSKQLPVFYPNLEFHFNRKDTINGELDIYIPSLKLAFELNGIIHYEPIYGPDKLSSIQSNDGRKFQACLEKGIELGIIDISTMKNFKPIKAMIFFDHIKKIIDLKMISISLEH